MTPSKSPTATLPSGARMPLLGLGTWRLHGEQATRATRAALDAGYRHVDTATMYGNEREVGAALRPGTFVTTKLPPERADRPREVLEQSLDLLGLDALDLWLVHWPTDDVVGTWTALVQAQAEGLVRDIGVSNHSLAQVDALVEATGVVPAVNQVPFSPRRFDAQLLRGHRDRGVVVVGYSGLKGGTLELPGVRAVAEKHGRTPAQVVVRWHLHHGVGVIPKSADPGRIAQNADVGFSLSEQDVAELDALAGTG